MKNEKCRTRNDECGKITHAVFARLFLVLSSFIVHHSSFATDEPITPQTEASIDRALKYLADKQTKEGTWPTNLGPSSAVTSLATMAFLARGHLPGQGPYGEHINKSIDYIIAHQMSNGLLSASNGTMYDHGASTVMLCEAFGMVDDVRKPKLEAAIAKAAKVILDAQKIPQGPHQGGWRYQINSNDSDISVTGWQLMALRGAANCGAAVPKSALDKGVAYIRRLAVHDEGGFGYQNGGGPNRARTGTGILSLEMLGQHTEKQPHLPEALAGGDYLLKNPLTNPGEEFYYYSVYYGSQAANQLGGKYWDGIYPKIRETLLARQRQDGSWPEGPGAEQAAGHAYSTSMAVLALCVPYHYLPLYQK
jgi:hypothetical protein